jgi:hypothetical protein
MQISNHLQKKKNNWVPLIVSPFGLLVADGWCWFVLREKYWWLVCCERKVLLAGG